jgi:glucokinase
LSESQQFKHLQVINDFEAVGHAVGALRATDLNPIGTQRLSLPMTQGVCAIVGVGTGLGVGGVIANAGTFSVLATEGGHASFAPTSERAIELLRWLRKKYGRVSAERVLSGAGLANLYLAFCAIDGVQQPELSASEITTRANEGGDAISVEAVGLFCELLGSFAGDLALTLGAWQGVLISGAMLQHFDRSMLERRVRSGFEYKGRFTPSMRGIPVETIAHPHVELLGAARLLLNS